MLSAFLYITIRKTNAGLFKQHMSFGSPEGFCSTKVRENASPYGMLKDICGTFIGGKHICVLVLVMMSIVWWKDAI